MERQSENDGIYQDAITQWPSLNGYTHIVRVFATPATISRLSIIVAMQTAFDELRFRIPWLGHQVITTDAGPGASRFIKSAPWPASAPPNRVVSSEKANTFPSLKSILASGGGFVESEELVPCPGLPEPHSLDPAPVMGIRVVFVEGGAMVILSAHHNMIDGWGIMQLWEHLATLICGSKIPEAHVQAATADRARVVPLLLPGEPAKDYWHLMRPDPWPLPAPPENTEWRLFQLSRSALVEMKAIATKTTDTTSHAGSQSTALLPTPQVSLDDALTALCWQRISAVRLASGRVLPEQVSKLGRAVSGREAMGLNPAYLGHIVLHAATRLPIKRAANSPLSELARQLRLDLEEAKTEWSVRSCATFMAGVPDKSKLIYGGITNPRTDVGVTSLLSWARRSRPYRMGILGDSKMMRKPQGAQIPGCLYLLPSDDQTSEIQILLCLPREDLVDLAMDSCWRGYMRPLENRVQGFKL